MSDQDRNTIDWHRVTVTVACAAAAALAAFSLGFWIAEGREIIPRPMFSLLVTALATAVITSSIVRATRSVLRGQRVVLQRLAEVEARVLPAPVVGRVTVVQPRAEVDTEAIEMPPAPAEPTHPPRRRRRQRPTHNDVKIAYELGKMSGQDSESSSES